MDTKEPPQSNYDNSGIKPIGRLPVKLYGSNKFIDIVKEVNQFITSKFQKKSKIPD